MMFEPRGINAVDIDTTERIEVGPGCYGRDLPSRPGIRMWVADMDPGAELPQPDSHDEGGEDIYVAQGALIEGDQRFEAGTFIHFDPHSIHRPRTDVGVRLLGINLL